MAPMVTMFGFRIRLVPGIPKFAQQHPLVGGVVVGVAETVAVEVEVLVGVLVTVFTGVLVLVGVTVCVTVRVKVAVLVTVEVGTFVVVLVAVAVLVAVMVGVLVCVLVTVGVAVLAGHRTPFQVVCFGALQQSACDGSSSHCDVAITLQDPSALNPSLPSAKKQKQH